SGIIGFPLRLLARENYDRMVARKGARYVALITGEEKIIPPDAKWFSCTVEAMPLDRHAEFVAVDEIQLCADPDRGHVFTDRLLHARGMVETMFLGAETIRPLLHRLVPQAEVETRPRLSQLTYAGPSKLVRLPPRSAVVAFSASEVYALAELIRRRKGGCAVVMGRLSPRTRNAQVALYQEREVDFLVATDAIGMGLNMNVDHVAFAGLGKFDGHRPRRLTPAEIGQIAGRAGRGMKDGTFGTTTECPPIPDEVVEAVEAHEFEALDVLCWRNSDLDFTSVDALVGSLNAPPARQGLVRGNEASDLETLTALARDPDLRKLAQGRRQVRLLWDACQIPDFRKLADDTHAKLCARVFGHVATETTLPTDWLAAQIQALDRTEGDIDTLMQRLSGVRVWSYIAARSEWVKDTNHWQARAREVEDKLSDALHESLTSRFVDRRAAHLMRRLQSGESEDLLSAVTRRGEVMVEGHPVGRIEGFRFVPDPEAAGEEKKLVMRAARRALRASMPAQVNRLEAAGDEDFAFTPDHRLLWEGASVARLVRGVSPLRPRVQVLESEFLDGSERERVRAKLQAWLQARIAADLAPLFAAEAAAQASPALRGPLHRMTEALGLVPGEDEETLAHDIRPKLRELGVRSGRFALFMPALMKPRAAAMRMRLWSLFQGVKLAALPNAALVSVPADQPAWPAGFAAAAGWIAAGPILLRLDIAERIAGELGHRARRGPAVLPAGLASRMAIKPDLLPVVLRALGFRVLPAGGLAPDQVGPPAPPMLTPLRRPRPQREMARRPAKMREADPVRVAHTGPFAALAALRR
ncbi:MAG TPA: helicase-related protein, partial [Rhodopila sp.]|uniref:helicase-related protein n=1 Tax=Rhodopila sp. TaxID=2480087 RepID=UPI002BD112A3